jgi:hypothetical protein
MKVLISTLAVLVLALPAEAQLTLSISNGRVSLDAKSVPTRQILAEWARIGGTKIVGGEKITGAPLTLKLVDMPEKQALEIILRNVAGFMAAPRQASAAPGESTYDRILIMATSSAPATTPSAASRGGAASQNSGNAVNGTARRVPPRPPNFPVAVGDDAATDDDERDDQSDTGVPDQPVFTFPAPAAQGGAAVFTPMPAGQQPPGNVTAPVITLQPGTNGPTIYNFVPNEPQAPAPAVGPFGAPGAPAPGMIQMPAPTPGQPTRPPTTRPPGS